MKEYFCTNEQLGFILRTGTDSQIDWEAHGFNVMEVSKAVSKGFQGTDSTGAIVSVLPIADKAKFNLALGNLVALGTDGDVYYRVITEENALMEKVKLDTARAAQEAQHETT